MMWRLAKGASALKRELLFNPAASLRHLSVVAWGRNSEGQCGAGDGVPVVLKPTEIEALRGEDLRALTAGKLTSAAVTAQGDAWVWGEGRAGKLGHGSNTDAATAARVEALVGRTRVRSVALGDSHSLFLDEDGGVWGCGENKEGQLGLGTPIEVIASQHRAAYHQSTQRAAAFSSHHHGSSSSPSSSSSSSSSSLQAPPDFLPPPPSLHRGAEAPRSPPSTTRPSETFPWLQDANLSEKRAAAAATASPSPGGGGDGDFHAMRERLRQKAAEEHGAARSFLLGAMGLPGGAMPEGLEAQPGQQQSPTRLGLDRHPLFRLRHPGGGADAPPRTAEDLHRGLEDESVLSLAASSYFSAAVTSAGEVWTFGACFNGSLGGDSNWSTTARRVGEPLASLLEEHGGAVDVVTGGTFCAALTTRGKVVLWGRVPMPLPKTPEGGLPSAGAMAPLGLRGGRVTVSRTARPTDYAHVLGAVVPGLPPIKHLDAGRHHVLLSDGESVWGVGRWMDDEGEETGGAPHTEPVRMLHLPVEGVASVHCGAHSSGVVTGAGRVWMWGRMLDCDDATLMIQRAEASKRRPSGRTSSSSSSPSSPGSLGRNEGDEDKDEKEEEGGARELKGVDWTWAGFGAAEPSLVEGLEGVRGLALGGWHAIALVD